MIQILESPFALSTSSMFLAERSRRTHPPLTLSRRLFVSPKTSGNQLLSLSLSLSLKNSHRLFLALARLSRMAGSTSYECDCPPNLIAALSKQSYMPLQLSNDRRLTQTIPLFRLQRRF
ncbi:unnamed protein product [Linum trigynum]|uniref:Uncharacterized protein n=1 Tax=Linum trigynum TaxID=586398 RepID=A0AAV2G5G7_9ROSI